MTLSIDYPAHLPDTLQMSPAQFEREAKLALAAKLFESNKLSSGLAAQIAGLDRVAFLMQLHRLGVSAMNMQEDELAEDARNA